ncbi:MAG TPA: prepilin-type N-terminal cleavage/methylation domain-containing protein [bacterium]|nr:prepilin-type N-terminal cleavage/methylation domain-containing protein [bacterium]HQQ00401.1 prepilin-type N-terminal cleavage/methylation domain-containing protein [bacterium]
MNAIRMRDANGFTLIEIIAVIAIIGILAAIAVPKFIDLSKEAKIGAAKGTFTAMESATALAFAKHRAQSLEKDGDAALDKLITDFNVLESYLDGGFPQEVEVKKDEVTLQDGTKVTFSQVETVEERAKLKKAGSSW